MRLVVVIRIGRGREYFSFPQVIAAAIVGNRVP